MGKMQFGQKCTFFLKLKNESTKSTKYCLNFKENHLEINTQNSCSRFGYKVAFTQES